MADADHVTHQGHVALVLARAHHLEKPHDVLDFEDLFKMSFACLHFLISLLLDDFNVHAFQSFLSTPLGCPRVPQTKGSRNYI